jgi:hypothetical protein
MIFTQISVFISEILLEQWDTSLCIVYDSFSFTMAKLSSCNRDYVAHKAENIYYQSL